MATTNSKFLVKNGLAVAGSTGAIDVINTSGQWIGATGTLHGATGVAGATGVSGATGTSGDRYLTTSSTSFTIADTGSQTVTVGTGLAYSANQTIILTYDTSNHQHGRVTSYNSGTGSLVFDKTDFQGSGTYASWTVNLDGAVGAQGASGATGVIQNWSVKTTTYTAVNKDSIVANTSGGAFTITLPATPSTGWSVSFADPAGTWDTNNLTVARNGSTIEGSATDLVLDVSHVSVDLVYDGSTWQVFTNIGPPGATGVSVQGASGATGVNGATGATGVQGASGVGASGVQGASGVAGTNGATGPAGSNGTNGATGTAGVNGATGPSGGGSSTMSPFILVGATGGQGATGPLGAGWVGGALFVGPQGATGVAWGATGSVNASVYISTGATGATGFVGATGTITAPTGYFNSIFLAGTALTSGVTVTDDTTTNSSHYVVLEDVTSGSISTVKVSSTKLYFNPSTGTLNATVFNSLSDIKYKENITVVPDSLQIVDKLDGVSFTWKENGNKSYGVIAQDLEKILPELVDGDDIKSVNYNGIIAILINAIKEQQVQIDELKQKILNN